MALDRKQIAQAGLELIDEQGLNKLTTRRLGERLGVEGPALYRHFRSKDELVDEMVGELLFPVLLPPAAGQPWDEWLRGICRRALDQVTRFRDGAKLIALSLPIEPLDLLSKPLREAGFGDEEARYASKLVSRFMVGWQLQEDHERHRKDRVSEEYDHEAAFEFAIDCLIEGMRKRLEGGAT
jgi:TetR/AcrR family tetracycline transcriptional repressor